jgi:beta-glucanase (GH16 family)
MKKLYYLLTLFLLITLLSSCTELNIKTIIGNAPELNGLEPLKVSLGSQVDLLEGVTGFDIEDGDITSQIEIINLSALPIYQNRYTFEGIYYIQYNITDSDQNSVLYYRKLEIVNASLNCYTPYDNMTLTFCDDFDNPENPNENGIDLSKWDFQYGNGQLYGIPGWGNNESQYYKKENAFVLDSILHIEGKLENVDGYRYTSSKLYTKDRFSQTYGRFEASISLPLGDGLWPAFWMLPENSPYGSWAASGEIDIMEARGRIASEASGAIHFGGQWPDNTYTYKTYTFPRNTFITDYNLYAIEWREGNIKWFYNDVLFYEVTDWYSTNGAYPAPFNTDFHMILNLAIGGVYDGNILPSDSVFNEKVYMKVDFVRVYQFND